MVVTFLALTMNVTTAFASEANALACLHFICWQTYKRYDPFPTERTSSWTRWCCHIWVDAACWAKTSAHLVQSSWKFSKLKENCYICSAVINYHLCISRMLIRGKGKMFDGGKAAETNWLEWGISQWDPQILATSTGSHLKKNYTMMKAILQEKEKQWTIRIMNFSFWYQRAA